MKTSKYSQQFTICFRSQRNMRKTWGKIEKRKRKEREKEKEKGREWGRGWEKIRRKKNYIAREKERKAARGKSKNCNFTSITQDFPRYYFEQLPSSRHHISNTFSFSMPSSFPLAWRPRILSKENWAATSNPFPCSVKGAQWHTP